MENYIRINDRQIPLTDEQVRQIINAYIPAATRLSELSVGETFRIGERELVILEQFEESAAVILRELLPEDMEFGANNNYDGSNVDEACRGFVQEIANVVGGDNIVPHEVDLTSDDGLKDYGKIERRCSSLTADLYRRYVEILDKFKPDRWWWLATAHSTKTHGNDSWAKCVSPSGCVIDFLYCGDRGVRPFCILKSTIFVSRCKREDFSVAGIWR